jgi:hypothetical protein
MDKLSEQEKLIQKATATKRHEAQTSEIHERISNEKALRKQSMLRQKELQTELTSTTLTAKGAKSRAVVPSLPLLHGSSSGRVRTTKTIEIARVAADPYPIHARGTYITSLRSFNNLTAFTQALDQGAFEALENTDDTYLGPAFSNGTQTPIPANIGTGEY